MQSGVQRLHKLSEVSASLASSEMSNKRRRILEGDEEEEQGEHDFLSFARVGRKPWLPSRVYS